MSFKKWLVEQLIDEGILDEDDIDIDDITKDYLYVITELDDITLESYQDEFTRVCTTNNEDPDWDLADY